MPNATELMWPSLGLSVFSAFALLGNVLVALSVFKERSLQYVTNYFVVNMAMADLMVAVLVMPFAIYSQVDTWRLGEAACSIFCCLDVVSTTASIYSMVAISADRWYSVKYHSKYAVKTAKRSYRVTSLVVLLLIWLVAWTVGLPVLDGKIVRLIGRECLFNDNDFIIYSSIISYFGPALIMLLFHLATVYVRKRQINLLFREHTLTLDPDMGFGSSPAFLNHYSSTARQHAGSVKSDSVGVLSQTGSRRDSQLTQPDTSNQNYENFGGSVKSVGFTARNSARADPAVESGGMDRLRVVEPQNNGDRTATYDWKGVNELTPFRERAKRYSISSFGHGAGLYAFKVKRLKYWWFRGGKHFYHGKVMTKKERRDRNTTRTLTVVVAAFLLCWLPFFTLHTADALCDKLARYHCIHHTPLLLATWLGYISSGLNPLIYTTFNPDFRKAFHNIGQRVICYTKVQQEDPKRSASFFDRCDDL